MLDDLATAPGVDDPAVTRRPAPHRSDRQAPEVAVLVPDGDIALLGSADGPASQDLRTGTTAPLDASTCGGAPHRDAGDLPVQVLSDHDLATDLDLATALVADRVRQVLDRSTVRTLFQPVVELSTGAVVAYEALSRFDGGSGTGGVFSHAARCGLEQELEVLVLRAALHSIRAATPNLPVALNLSPGSLLLPEVTDALLVHGTCGLAVEITEHSPVRDYESLIEVLTTLRAAGIGLSIDDVGAGYASLRHVLRLRPDTIKVDIGIVEGVHGDPARAALVSALVAFAAETGCRLVAEGIERPEERRTLLARGVRFGQGFLLGRPAPLPGRAGR